MIERTIEQRNILSRVQSEVALVQFLPIRDQIEAEGYIASWTSVVGQQNGRQRHQCRIDQILAGSEMPYNMILVDTFSSGHSALQAFAAGEESRSASMVGAYVLAVKPSGNVMLKLVRRLGFLAPITGRLVGTTSERPLPGIGNWDPNTGPVPETINLFRKDDQLSPFYMMNLNKYYARARYPDGEDISGDEAYARYRNRIVPYLISVGGYPDLMGSVIGVLAGAEASPLHDEWSEFAMVYYPSRQNFLRMMTNSPTKGIHHRAAGLERAVLMPSSHWPSP